MRTKIIESTNPDGLYLKAMVGRFDQEDWQRKPLAGAEHSSADTSLLRQEGWNGDHFIIQDLSNPGLGGIFHMDGLARADLESSTTRFGPLMLPFVEWLYEQGMSQEFPENLPDLVALRRLSPREVMNGT